MKNTVLISMVISLMLIGSMSFAALSIKIIPNPINIAVNSSTSAEIDVDSAPETTHNISIFGTLCKDMDGNPNTCEDLLENGGGEASVKFANGLLKTTTDSAGKTPINIMLGQNANPNAKYLFQVKVDDGGWQEAVVIGETNSVPIPEFPSSALPVALSMLSMGLVRMKYK